MEYQWPFCQNRPGEVCLYKMRARQRTHEEEFNVAFSCAHNESHVSEAMFQVSDPGSQKGTPVPMPRLKVRRMPVFDFRTFLRIIHSENPTLAFTSPRSKPRGSVSVFLYEVRGCSQVFDVHDH